MSVVTLDSIRFYNGQTSPFEQRFMYTKPDTDFREENGIAYYHINSAPLSFFNVPFELETSTGGVWRISIHREISERFGERGLVRVEANSRQSLINDIEKLDADGLLQAAQQAVYKHQLDDFRKIGQQLMDKIKSLVDAPKLNQSALVNALAEYQILTSTEDRFAFVAFDDASAKLKGKALWRRYLRRQIEDFEHENNRRVTERGQTALRPNNFIMHAYKELGMEVPGDEKFAVASAQQTDVGELKQTVADQQKTINVLLEKLEKLVPATPAEATAGAKKSA